MSASGQKLLFVTDSVRPKAAAHAPINSQCREQRSPTEISPRLGITAAVHD